MTEEAARPLHDGTNRLDQTRPNPIKVNQTDEQEAGRETRPATTGTVALPKTCCAVRESAENIEKRAESAKNIVVVRLMRFFASVLFPGQNQAGSRLIKPNQTKSHLIEPPGGTSSGTRRSQHKLLAARFAGYSSLPKIAWSMLIKPNQTCGGRAGQDEG
jgi:hypothetical protein